MTKPASKTAGKTEVRRRSEITATFDAADFPLHLRMRVDHGDHEQDVLFVGTDTSPMYGISVKLDKVPAFIGLIETLLEEANVGND